MSSLLRLLNRLLPFATPGTPVIQDVIHLGVLAALLYYAPQIQEHFQKRALAATDHASNEDDDGAEVQAFDNAPHRGFEGDVWPRGNNERDEAQPIQHEQRGAQQRRDNPATNANGIPPAERDDVDEPGPANPAAARMPLNQRNIGAKKAKSLAKKDQRRAYHEFQRSQGDAQRAKDAEGAVEREAAQAAAQARRKATEAKLEERKAKEREKRRGQERQEREEQIALRERAVDIVKEALEGKRMCNLFDVAGDVGGDLDEVSLEKILVAAGVVGTSKDDGAMTMVTSAGWVVRVGRGDMQRAYEAAGAGKEKEIGYEKFGEILQKTLLGGLYD